MYTHTLTHTHARTQAHARTHARTHTHTHTKTHSHTTHTCRIRSKKAFQLAWKEKFKGKGVQFVRGSATGIHYYSLKLNYTKQVFY